MNTSHNKNRVIEHGWKNVFKNIVGYKNTKISPQNSCRSSISASSQSTTDNSKRKQRINIFAISTQKDNKSEVKSFSDPRCLSPVASSSKSQFWADPPQCKRSDSSLSPCDSVNPAAQICDRETCRCNSLILTAEGLNLKDKKQELSLKLIHKMSENKGDEEKYLEYFKRLISFEEFCKDKESIDLDELQNEILIPQNDSFKIICKHVKSKGREEKVEKKTKKAGTKSDISSEGNKESETTVKNTKSAKEGPKTERIVMRTEILNNLSTCYVKDTTYDSLMNELIDIEESFIPS